MGFESWPSFQKSAEKPKEKMAPKLNKTTEQKSPVPKESDIYKRARAELKVICQKFDDPNQRLAEIVKKIEPFFQHIDKKILPVEKIEEIRSDLRSSELVQNKDEFLELVMKTLKPALDIREAQADKFEEAQARAMNETGGFTEINRLLSYGKSGSTIHIHAPAGKTVGSKITLYRDGMRKLAEIINNDPEINEVTATSPLVAAHPGLFMRAGFKVEDVSDEFRQKHFAGEEGEIKIAKIAREAFLKRFLKKRFEHSQTPEKISAKQMKAIIQDVIDDTFSLFDIATMADYDADFSGEEPYFINIWTKQKGYGFGYIVFHDFLRRVGVQKTFLSTDFTPEGSNLFQKAIKDGLIEKVSEPFGLQRLTRWRVVSDPVKNLEKLRDQNL